MTVDKQTRFRLHKHVFFFEISSRREDEEKEKTETNDSRSCERPNPSLHFHSPLGYLQESTSSVVQYSKRER